MILIDKAKLMNHIENESRAWGEDYDNYQILGDIEDFEIVEAIPIQFLKDWSEQNEYDETIPRTIPLVLSDWEEWKKEND